MGAWGADTFENDDACDFAKEVAATNDISQLDRALDEVLDTSGYLEAPVASIGLAAADIVARLRGHLGQQDAYTEATDAWVSTKKFSPSQQTADKAVAVINRVRTEPSELLELWSEGDPADWFAALDTLKQRLTQPPSNGGKPTSDDSEKPGIFSRWFRR